MVLPSLYIIVASLAPGLPLYNVFSNANGSGLSVIVTLASIALGYGIPYSFLSGFEVADDDAVEEEQASMFRVVLRLILQMMKMPRTQALRKQMKHRKTLPKANQPMKPTTAKRLDSVKQILNNRYPHGLCGYFLYVPKVAKIRS